MELIQYVQTISSEIETAEFMTAGVEVKYAALISKCAAADWSKMELEALNKTDNILSNSAADAHAMAQAIEDRRKPITKKLDEFRSEFTGRERRCYDVSIVINDIRKKIALELKRRADIEAQKQLTITYKTNEEIEFKRTLNKYLIEKSYAHAQEVMRNMYNASLTNDIDQYNLFMTNLISFDVKNTITIDTLTVWLSHFTFKFVYIDPIVPVAMLDTWNNYISPQVDTYRQQLISQSDKRKEAIFGKVETTAEEVVHQLNDINDSLELSKIDAVSAVNQASESEVIHKSFESYSTAKVVRQNKGVKTTKELAPANSGEWLNIIKFFIDNIYPTLDMETIEKKLGFMLTAVNKSMVSDGVLPDGVTLIDKVKIRSGKSTQP